MDERRVHQRVPTTGTSVSVKSKSFMGKVLAEDAEVLDVSQGGLAIKLPLKLEEGTVYKIGYSLTWSKSVSHFLVKVAYTKKIDDTYFQHGLQVIQDDTATLSFIKTALDKAHGEFDK